MRFELKLNKITMDAAGVKNSMLPYIRKALDVAEDRLIDIIREEIDLVSGSPHEWRDILKAHIKHIREEITGDVLRYYIGPEYSEDPENALWMRAMVIAFGNAPPIYAGPEGAEVWDNDLWSRTESKVKVQKEIPQSWYHEGRNYIENAIRIMRTEFADIIIGELASMPASVFSSNIKVSSR